MRSMLFRPRKIKNDEIFKNVLATVYIKPPLLPSPKGPK